MVGCERVDTTSFNGEGRRVFEELRFIIGIAPRDYLYSCIFDKAISIRLVLGKHCIFANYIR